MMLLQGRARRLPEPGFFLRSATRTAVLLLGITASCYPRSQWLPWGKPRTWESKLGTKSYVTQRAASAPVWARWKHHVEILVVGALGNSHRVHWDDLHLQLTRRVLVAKGPLAAIHVASRAPTTSRCPSCRAMPARWGSGLLLRAARPTVDSAGPCRRFPSRLLPIARVKAHCVRR